MKKQSCIRLAAIVALLIIIAAGCEQESLELQSAATADCGGCADPGGGLVIGQPPVISSFSPQRGLIGTKVTITGSRFNATPAYNVVKFDGVQAFVASATTTSLVVYVPDGATSGKISVTVSGLTGESAAYFRVIDIPLAGLVAFYPFDGNANDITTEQSNGTPMYSPALANDRHGYANSAYDFTNGGYINMGNPAELQITQQMTLSAWLRPAIGSSGAPISKDGNFGGCVGYRLIQSYYNTTGAHFVAFSSSAATYFLASTPFLVNTWTQITVTISGTTVKLYKNGQLAATYTNYHGLDNNAGNFMINGYSCSGYAGYKGSVDDVAVYNRALTDEEVVKLYQQNILL